MKYTYLDWAASTAPDPYITEQMREDQIKYPGNPSSPHALGREAAVYLASARKNCAEALDVDPSHLFFTSGGTESDAIPLLSLLRTKRRGGELVLSSIEHSAVYELASTFRDLGYRVLFVDPDRNGIIQAEKVEELLSPDTIGVSVMMVNNETGAIQPIGEIARRVRAFERRAGTDILFHCDAVQALGKIPFQLRSLGIDSAAFSAHKIMGPRGIGLLYASPKLPVLSSGGGQEQGIRPGTENPAAAAAFSGVLRRSLEDLAQNSDHARILYEKLLAELADFPGISPLPGTRSSSSKDFTPFILSIFTNPIPGELLARVLSDRGFMIGTGSACSSLRKKKKGRVASAMGVGERNLPGIIRVSFGPTTTLDEVSSFAKALRGEITLLRRTIKNTD